MITNNIYDNISSYIDLVNPFTIIERWKYIMRFHQSPYANLQSLLTFIQISQYISLTMSTYFITYAFFIPNHISHYHLFISLCQIIETHKHCKIGWFWETSKLYINFFIFIVGQLLAPSIRFQCSLNAIVDCSDLTATQKLSLSYLEFTFAIIYPTKWVICPRI